MPKYTFGNYTPDALDALANDLQRLVEYFRGAAQLMRSSSTASLEIAGDDAKNNGLRFIRVFRRFTEQAMDGEGPRPPEPKGKSAKIPSQKKSASK